MILVTPGIIWSLKLKTKRTKVEICGMPILTFHKIISCQFLLILLEGANHEQSSQNNQST